MIALVREFRKRTSIIFNRADKYTKIRQGGSQILDVCLEPFKTITSDNICCG